MGPHLFFLQAQKRELDHIRQNYRKNSLARSPVASSASVSGHPHGDQAQPEPPMVFFSSETGGGPGGGGMGGSDDDEDEETEK